MMRILSSGRRSLRNVSMPTLAAICRAAAALSPVSSIGVIPAALSSFTVRAASSRTLSDSAICPTVVPSAPTYTNVAPCESCSSAFLRAMSVPEISQDLPTVTAMPSTVQDTPCAALIMKSVTSSYLPPRSVYSLHIALPSGCSDFCSAFAARRSMSSSVNLLSYDTVSATCGLPQVRVPVLSNATRFIRDSLSSASPERMIMPYLAAFPMPAITAVGVASMNAQGQNTTSTVTALMKSCVASPVMTAQESAMTTSHVAQRSAAFTIGALFSSASLVRRTMRCRELSSLSRSHLIVNVPNRFIVPLDTVSPAVLSTGRLSPVMTD